MKTKSKIEQQLKKKTNRDLVETIIAAKKQKAWLKVADILAGPTRQRVNLNLEEINSKVKDGEKIIIPGKILSKGDVEKKVKIIALGFSESAKEKLLNSKNEISSILEEIKKNPEAKGIRILNNNESN